MGADLNANLEFGFEITGHKGVKEQVNVFPNFATDTTVYKKRTLIQAQKHKAN